MSHDVFKRGMALLVKAFPDKEMDYDILWQFTEDLEDLAFMQSVSRLIMTSPNINRATNLVALIREGAVPEDETAGQAWGEVLQKISSVGSWGKPEFSSPLIKQAVEGVGWKDMCMSENISMERAHFLKIYEALLKRKRTTDLVCNNVDRICADVIGKIEDRSLRK